MPSIILIYDTCAIKVKLVSFAAIFLATSYKDSCLAPLCVHLFTRPCVYLYTKT